MASFLQDLFSHPVSIIYKQQKSRYDVIVCSKLFLLIPLLRENTRPKRVDNSKKSILRAVPYCGFSAVWECSFRNPPALYRLPSLEDSFHGIYAFQELKISTFQKRLTNADFASTLWITRPNIPSATVPPGSIKSRERDYFGTAGIIKRRSIEFDMILFPVCDQVKQLKLPWNTIYLSS